MRHIFREWHNALQHMQLPSSSILVTRLAIICTGLSVGVLTSIAKVVS